MLVSRNFSGKLCSDTDVTLRENYLSSGFLKLCKEASGFRERNIFLGHYVTVKLLYLMCSSSVVPSFTACLYSCSPFHVGFDSGLDFPLVSTLITGTLHF